MAVAEMPRPVQNREDDYQEFRRLLTVDEFQRMAASDIFAPDERLELIRGEIYQKMPPDPPHASLTDVIADFMRPLAWAANACVRTEKPLILNGHGQPEPDIAIVRGSLRDYEHHHPAAADALLVIEVSDSTLRKDRGLKRADYAAAGLPEYWIVNLNARCIEVHRNAVNGAWATAFTKTDTEMEAPLFAPDSPLRVADLLLSR